MSIRSAAVLMAACLAAAVVHAQAPLRVIVFPGGANLPLWVAEAQGLFAKEGLAVTITSTPNSVFLVQALMKGDQDIALSTLDNIVGYQEGQGEVTLAEPPDFFAFMGFSHGTVRLVAHPEVKSIAELKGRTLGVDAVATGYSMVLMKLLQQGGLAPDDYRLESIGGTANRARALMEDRTPATILTTPLELAPEAKGYRRLANVADAIGPYQTIVGMARRSWAGAHREALTGFVRASATALDWLFDPAHKAQAIAIYRRHLPEVPEAAAAAAVTAMTGEREGFLRGGRFDIEGAATVVRLRSEFGRPKKDLADPSRYLDDTYLRAAGAR